VHVGTIVHKDIIIHSFCHINSVMVSWDHKAWIKVIKRTGSFIAFSFQIETNIAIVLAT